MKRLVTAFVIAASLLVPAGTARATSLPFLAAVDGNRTYNFYFANPVNGGPYNSLTLGYVIWMDAGTWPLDPTWIDEFSIAATLDGVDVPGTEFTVNKLIVNPLESNTWYFPPTVVNGDFSGASSYGVRFSFQFTSVDGEAIVEGMVGMSQVTAVPDPGPSPLVFGIGVGGLIAWKRRHA